MDDLKIHKALNRCLGESQILVRDICEFKAIFFSDHHRGRGDGADDFAACEKTYLQALEYYNTENFELYLLGDVEEFWENSFGLVMRRYTNVLKSEKAFFDDKRFYRIWGNHDDEWRYLKFINKWLGEMFPKLYVPESFVIQFVDNEEFLGNLLLVHGHQGSLESDRFAGVSKFFVRYFWRNIQRMFKIPLSTPATSFDMRSKLDEILYAWASDKDRQAIMCGHTHQPVFMSLKESEDLENELDANMDGHSQIKNNSSYTEKEPNEQNIAENDWKKPCYFNTGCCSYSDGDISGIEIENGRINLIKWNQKGERVVLSDQTGHNRIIDIFKS